MDLDLRPVLRHARQNQTLFLPAAGGNIRRPSNAAPPVVSSQLMARFAAPQETSRWVQNIWRSPGEDPERFVRGNRSGRRGFNGLGTCQWPQPGVAMVYPSCADDPSYQATVSRRLPPNTVYSVYDVPGLTLPPASSCVDAQGNVAADPACVEENLRIQQENFRRYAAYNNDPAFRAQFTQDTPAPTAPVEGPLYKVVDTRNTRFSFTNLTSGNNSRLNAGDRWQVQISGAAPNSPVVVTGGPNGSNASTPQGSTDGSGNFALNGAITPDLVGEWRERWTVGGVPVADFGFTVPGSGSAPSSQQQTTPTTQTQAPQAFNMDFLTKPVAVGGSEFPMWALIGAGLVAAYFFMGRR